MQILALGPMEARLNGRQYPIGGVKQRALLARLLTARGRPVSVAGLCEELSEGTANRDPVHALQTRVSRLRAALPSLEIEQVGSGYRLDHLRIDTDISRFEKLREEGGWLLSDGALLQAADRLRDALTLWRGPAAFADVLSVPAIQAESVRLNKLWASTLADRIDIDLALGREVEVIPELAAIVEENLLFERFWGQLMAALYRDGQVQEALDVYARARKIFSERFGMEPNGELGKLHLQILRKEPSESLLRFPLAAPLPPPPNESLVLNGQSKPSITSNRADVLADLLPNHGALILTGPTGIGKTHLLRSVRAHLEAQHCLVPLLSASELSQSIPLGVFAGVAGSLSEDWTSAIDVIDSFARHRSTTVLLVDNVNLLDDSSLFVIRQLINTARVAVLIAARTLTEAPEEIRALYDSGELTEIAVELLSDDEANELSVAITGGPLTPDTRLRVLEAAAGIPLRIREIITGSQATGQMRLTDSGWELQGDPSPSPRLAQLAGERFDDLDASVLEAVSLVAVAGEFPLEALDPALRRTIARTDVLTLSDNGWLRLADPMDREVLRARCSDLMWHELTREAVQVLTSDLADKAPQARRRAHLLALDLGTQVDAPATVALAERALGAFDERLALRAAEAVIAQEAESVEAHRIAGVAASVLRMPDAAEAHFNEAYRHSRSGAEQTAVALDHARHCGLRLHDADRALAVIEKAIDESDDADENANATAHLRRARMRWMAVAGKGVEAAPSPEMPGDAAGVMGLIVVGLSGVITGPLQEAHRALAQLHQVPSEIIDLVPGGKTLIALIETMAISYSGDLASTQQMLIQKIAEAKARAPESLGEWEYAFGFSELLSGNATAAHTLAIAAVEHLEWRDTTGLLPAAQALRAASAKETGDRDSTPQFGFDVIPESATGDPKVVMLRRWSEARIMVREERGAEAAHTLVETAQWLLAAQHSYFAGMCAHYAVRTGYEQHAARAVLKDAHGIAGGGMLALLVRHAEASLAVDLFELDRIAHEARELGLLATAADTWAFVVENSEAHGSSKRLQHQRAAIGQLYAEAPALVSWVA